MIHTLNSYRFKYFMLFKMDFTSLKAYQVHAKNFFIKPNNFTKLKISLDKLKISLDKLKNKCLHMVLLFFINY